MAIITKPSTVSRGTKATFTLNKNDLAANSIVSNDSYFSSQSVWNTVALHYKSNARDQHEEVLFNAIEATPEGDFLVSQHSVGDFLIDHISISDFDGGRLIVPRSSLTVIDFDVTF